MRVRLALVPLAVAATLLAGCASKNPVTPATAGPTTPASNGVADLKAEEIVAKAQAALTNAKSFHVKGSQAKDGTQVKLDFVFSDKNASGTIEASGLSLSVLCVGDSALYLKAPEALWAGAATTNLVDRYVGRLREKLGQPELIRTVRGVGFMLDV